MDFTVDANMITRSAPTVRDSRDRHRQPRRPAVVVALALQLHHLGLVLVQLKSTWRQGLDSEILQVKMCLLSYECLVSAISTLC